MHKLRTSAAALFLGIAMAFFAPVLVAQTSIWTGGGANCIPAPGDYDGDGDMDYSQFCGGAWHFYNADGSYLRGIWTAAPAGVPVPADYDNDWKTDVVLFNAGSWHFYDFNTGAYLANRSRWTGGNGIPAPIDFDGDGAAEMSQLANGAWHFYNEDGSYNRGIWVGNTPGNIPVPYNRDDDNAEEVVLFNRGVFHFYDFVTKAYQGGLALGTFNQPLPTPLELDGDGNMELGIYDVGIWHLYTTEGQYLGNRVTGGTGSDRPISRRPLP